MNENLIDVNKGDILLCKFAPRKSAIKPCTTLFKKEIMLIEDVESMCKIGKLNETKIIK